MLEWRRCDVVVYLQRLTRSRPVLFERRVPLQGSVKRLSANREHAGIHEPMIVFKTEQWGVLYAVLKPEAAKSRSKLLRERLQDLADKAVQLRLRGQQVERLGERLRLPPCHLFSPLAFQHLGPQCVDGRSQLVCALRCALGADHGIRGLLPQIGRGDPADGDYLGTVHWVRLVKCAHHFTTVGWFRQLYCLAGRSATAPWA